jgi:biopolymer transport protein ExbD
VLQLRVLPDGRVDVVSGGAGAAHQVTADEVAGLWRLAAAEKPLLIAAVETHPEASYYRLVDVLDALRQAGAERVSLKRLEPRPTGAER